MARLTVKRLIGIAWDVLIIAGALGAATFVGVGTALHRAEGWVDKRLT
jgi:hypothetical protein